jgi:hypothetical protein
MAIGNKFTLFLSIGRLRVKKQNTETILLQKCKKNATFANRNKKQDAARRNNLPGNYQLPLLVIHDSGNHHFAERSAEQSDTHQDNSMGNGHTRPAVHWTDNILHLRQRQPQTAADQPPLPHTDPEEKPSHLCPFRAEVEYT